MFARLILFGVAGLLREKDVDEFLVSGHRYILVHVPFLRNLSAQCVPPFDQQLARHELFPYQRF
jgi:hypothetical protein